MRKHHPVKLWAGGVAAAIALTACGQPQSGALKPLKITVEQAEADIEALRTEAFTMKAEGPADVAAIVAALPEGLTATWDALEFDAASGATVLRAVRISHSAAPDLAVTIDETRAWGLDAAFAAARLKGERLDETARLANRIDLTGVKLVGLEAFFAPAMDAYMDAVEEAAVDAIESAVEDAAISDAFTETLSDQATTLEHYNFSIGRFIIDDLTLRPFELKPVALPADSEWAKVMPVAQPAAAIYRSLAANAYGIFDTTAELAMSQYGEPIEMSYTIASTGVRGWRGGDLDASFGRGIAMEVDVSAPLAVAAQEAAETNTDIDIEETATTPALTQFAMDISVASTSHERMRLDALLGFLARGEMPPRSQTGLLGIGVSRVSDMQFAMNDTTFYSVGEYVIEAEDFHWFIPTRLRVAYSDFVYHLDGLGAIMQSLEPALADSPDMAMFNTMMPVLNKYGLDKPSMDFDLILEWNPGSGASTINLSGALDDYFHGDLNLNGVLPDFDAVAQHIPEDGGPPNDAAINEVFAEASAFKAFEWKIVDDGGLEKSFALAADIIAAMPPDDQAVAMLRNAGPQGLRQMAVSGIMLVGSQASASGAPQAEPLVAAFANFIAQGGTLTYSSKPKAPLNAEALEAAATPEAAFELMELKAVHTPPKE
jgi:hypothetical protein